MDMQMKSCFGLSFQGSCFKIITNQATKIYSSFLQKTHSTEPKGFLDAKFNSEQADG